jgi:hypothetical protein
MSHPNTTYQALLHEDMLPWIFVRSLIEIRLSSRTARWCTPPFPLQKNCCAVANCGFPQYFPSQKSLDYGSWGNGYGSLKNGRSDANRLATEGCQS